MTDQNTRSTDAAKSLGITPAPTEGQGRLPAVIEHPARRKRPRLRLAVPALLIIVAGAVLGGFWWHQHHPRLPPGIAKLFVDQGDMVTAGQVVAMMDARDLEASLKKSEALAGQAERALDEANANLTQQQTQVKLAHQELDRTSALVPRGFATVELLDQRRQQMNSAVAAENAATHRVAEAQHTLDAATHDVELYRVNILDNTLVAPRDGPIEYRVANIGEVLPAGGKVFTMLDASYVYMDIYLLTAEAGRVRIGSDARIVLDAYPGHVIPAKVVFVASQAQFTPKTVETKAERDKLMFRIRVRIDPERLKGREAMVRSGLPGVAYVATDPSVAWPAALQASAPPSIPASVLR